MNLDTKNYIDNFGFLYDNPVKPEAQFMNKPKIKPLELIERLRDIYGEYEPFSGGCLKFHLLLKSIYPRAATYYNVNHFVTVIDGKAYDQHGVVCPIHFAEGKYRYISDEEMPSIIRTFKDIDSKFIQNYGKN